MEQQVQKTRNKGRLWLGLFLVSSIWVIIAQYSITHKQLEMNSDRELIEHFEKHQAMYTKAIDIFFDKDKQSFIFDKKRKKKFATLKQKERIRSYIPDRHSGDLLLCFSSYWGNGYFYDKGFAYLQTSPSPADIVDNLNYIEESRKPPHDYQKTYEELTVMLYRPIKGNWYIYVKVTADLGS